MGTQKDRLSIPQIPDRVFYANGAVLDQEDFTIEQTYHRGRMGRALAYLHGSGTVAGLKVEVKGVNEEEKVIEKVIVYPGMAIDRLGRMIEVPRSACLRLTRWLEDLTTDSLNKSFREITEGSPPVVTFAGIVADVFIKFEVCEHGKQPAFSTGDFDALDAVAPSRLLDSYHLELVIREEETLPVPGSDVPDLSTMSYKEVVLYKLESWRESTKWTGTGDTLSPLPEHVTDGQQDYTGLLLARLWIPATYTASDPASDPATDPRPQRSSDPVNVDNTLRRIAYSTAELAAMIGR